jgi:hypothetical protein
LPAMYEIRQFPDGTVRRFAGSRGNYYELPGPDRLDVECAPAWCRRCDGIAEVEDLSTLEAIDQRIRHFKDSSSQRDYQDYPDDLRAFFESHDERFYHEYLADLERRRRWRETRTSPAKCILCGSSDTVPLPLDRRVPHPKGQGELQVAWTGMCSTSFNEWFFTPEGDRIPRDTRPTYWHHPVLDQPRHRRRLCDWLRSKVRGAGSDHAS